MGGPLQARPFHFDRPGLTQMGEGPTTAPREPNLAPQVQTVMLTPKKPTRRPVNPSFSSGPCAKRPGWTATALDNAFVGRSHRAVEGRNRLKAVIERTKAILRLPKGYQVAIVPASDTGAFEMAMWNLLGARGVDVFAWEVFGRIWLKDAIDELRLADLRVFDAPWGRLPDLGQADFTRDVVFAWNGTTSGVRVPDAAWISEAREGLTFCDATSAIFAQDIDFTRIDVLTFSWQKVLGGEAGQGMLILSPRALQRLESYDPPWPLPKIFRLKSDGKVLHDVFEGVTINTPSMLCVEDYADALTWAENLGGLRAMMARADANAEIIYQWAQGTSWLQPLAEEPATRSNTSVCFRLSDGGSAGKGPAAQLAFVSDITELLSEEGAAYDILAYRGVPSGLRIWTGATVSPSDLRILTEWLDWAHAEVTSRRQA